MFFFKKRTFGGGVGKIPCSNAETMIKTNNYFIYFYFKKIKLLNPPVINQLYSILKNELIISHNIK